MTAARKQISVRDGAERYIELARLMRRYREATAVVSGGNPSLIYGQRGQAEFARRLLGPMGVEMSRVQFETKSRNTEENIQYSHAMLNPKPDAVWVVVTSAFHMPRAMSLMDAAGWKAIPYPVDYRTEGARGRFFFTLDAGEPFAVADLAAKEWVGMLFNVLFGRTKAPWSEGPVS